MISRVKKWLYGIKADKFIHFIGGMVAAQVAFAMFGHCFPLWHCAVLSVFTAACIGGAKELLDMADNGVASWNDFWATVAGSVSGVLVMLVP